MSEKRANTVKTMKLTNEQRFYEIENNGEAILTVVLPEEGKFPKVLRQWKISPGGSVYYRNCTDQEVLDFEFTLGEVDLDNIEFEDHPTLGHVATLKNNLYL